MLTKDLLHTWAYDKAGGRRLCRYWSRFDIFKFLNKDKFNGILYSLTVEAKEMRDRFNEGKQLTKKNWFIAGYENTTELFFVDGFVEKINWPLIIETTTIGFTMNMLLALALKGDEELTPVEQALFAGYGESIRLCKADILCYDLPLHEDAADTMVDGVKVLKWSTDEVDLWFFAGIIYDMVRATEL